MSAMTMDMQATLSNSYQVLLKHENTGLCDDLALTGKGFDTMLQRQILPSTCHFTSLVIPRSLADLIIYLVTKELEQSRQGLRDIDVTKRNDFLCSHEMCKIHSIVISFDEMASVQDESCLSHYKRFLIKL